MKKMDRLKDKVILITGATSEIGQACVRIALREEAAAVIMSGIDDDAGMAQASALGRCTFFRLDVRLESDWKAAIENIRDRYGRLDVLINNAGITGSGLDSNGLDLSETTLETWRAVHSTNLEGIFLGCREAIPLMKASDSASIVNIGSRSGLVGRPERIAYGSSKAAVMSLTRSVAMYCAQKGYAIRCNAVLPSSILTSMWDPVLGHSDHFNGELHDRIASKIPLKRFGTPEEVANTVLFLASDESSYITGTEILVDGGAQARDGVR